MKKTFLAILLLSGCANLSLSRSASYTGGAAAAGAALGYAFSPNQESRCLNTLILGGNRRRVRVPF